MGEAVIALAMLLAAAAPAPGASQASSKLIDQVDLAAMTPRPQPKPGEAMVILRFHTPGMAGDNRVTFLRWNGARGGPATDAGPAGFKATYSATIFASKKKGERTLRAIIVPAGDYVLAARTFNGQMTDSFCFGAPRFTVAAGSVTYLGDFEMLVGAKMADGRRANAMAYSADLEGARTALAAVYPEQAKALAAWVPVNGTALPCGGDVFTAYGVPGAGAVVAR